MADDSIDEYFKVKEEKEEIIVGIDLGTTNSSIGIWRNNKLEIIPDEYGNRTIPSIVSYTNRTKYVGYEAKNQCELNPANTYYEVKRLIGRKYNDQTVKNDLPFLSYKIKDSDNKILLESDLTRRKSYYTPEEISAQVLLKLKHMAEYYLKTDVKKAVITVPAYFNDGQRQATRDSAIIAGLDPVRIINEPTAAALAYGFQERSVFDKETDKNILVCDIGGGTTDISLLNISNGVFEVLGSCGNTHLGGVDIDNALLTYCKTYFMKKHKFTTLSGISLLNIQKLKTSCENAKKLLTTQEKAIISVKNFYNNKNLLISLTKKKLNKLCNDLFILCMKPIHDIIEQSDITREEVDEIILVGGMTRMPIIQQNLKNFFNKPPNTSVNPDEVVTAGACIQAYMLSNKDDPFTSNVVLLDVLPLSLGVETMNTIMNTIIPRNTTIPVTKRKKYTNANDYESEITVKIYEGERKLTKDNFYVGQFDLENLEPEPRGYYDITIEFKVDVNGIINVSANEKKSKNKNSIIVSGNKGRLSNNEIEKLVKEAKEMETDDKNLRIKKQLYFEIDNYCNIMKINLKNDEFKLSKLEKEKTIADSNKIIDWLKEKSYSKRDRKDYENMLDRIKNKYGALILQTNKDDNNFKSRNVKQIESTNLFDEDDLKSNDDNFENINNNSDNEDEEEDQDKQYNNLMIKQKYLIDLCYSIYDLLNDTITKISKDEHDNLKDLINDILLWTHVKENIKECEYDDKINLINENCDNILQNYDNIFDNNLEIIDETNKLTQLENLCIALLTTIKNYSFKEDTVSEFNNLIDSNLKRINQIENEIKTKDVSINNYEQELNNLINELNTYSNKFYSNILNQNSVMNFEPFVENNNQNNDKTNDQNGTLLDDLKKN